MDTNAFFANGCTVFLDTFNWGEGRLLNWHAIDFTADVSPSAPDSIRFAGIPIKVIDPGLLKVNSVLLTPDVNGVYNFNVISSINNISPTNFSFLADDDGIMSWQIVPGGLKPVVNEKSITGNYLSLDQASHTFNTSTIVTAGVNPTTITLDTFNINNVSDQNIGMRFDVSIEGNYQVFVGGFVENWQARVLYKILVDDVQVAQQYVQPYVINAPSDQTVDSWIHALAVMAPGNHTVKVTLTVVRVNSAPAFTYDHALGSMIVQEIGGLTV